LGRRKILNRGNLTLGLLVWGHQTGIQNEGKTYTEEHYRGVPLYIIHAFVSISHWNMKHCCGKYEP
jgi:hypothetical protein